MLDELQRFILFSKEGNITKTAEKIFITQSALSQSIKRLETALGTKLFIQEGRYLHITTEGKAVVALGSKILQLWENIKDPTIRNSVEPTYTIGMFDNAALRLSKYFQNRLDVKNFHLELVIDSSGKLLSQLQWGLLDAAICVIGKEKQSSKYTTLLHTFTEDLIPVSSKTFSMPLATIPFILYNKGSHTRQQIDTIFIKNGIQPKIFAESTSTTFMKELAMLGNGVALLPKNFVKNDIHQGSLKKLRLPLFWKRKYGIFINNQSILTKDSQIIQDIVKMLKKST